jgi:hypothetical protein
MTLESSPAIMRGRRHRSRSVLSRTSRESPRWTCRGGRPDGHGAEVLLRPFGRPPCEARVGSCSLSDLLAGDPRSAIRRHDLGRLTERSAPVGSAPFARAGQNHRQTAPPARSSDSSESRCQHFHRGRRPSAGIDSPVLFLDDSGHAQPGIDRRPGRIRRPGRLEREHRR